MDQKPEHLFADFIETSLGADAPIPADSLAVRLARIEDVDDLGRISAHREGGDRRKHSVSFARAIESNESNEIDQTSLILVAETRTGIVGFGKARYLSEPQSSDSGESPEGWYLTGVVVDAGSRRRGVGSRLTAERLLWISRRSRHAYYFSNAQNRVSIALHQRFGFVEVARGPGFAGQTFVGGVGILFRADLTVG